MNLAKVSANGQITIPIDIRKILGVKSGDKVLFVQNSSGEIVISNAASVQPLTQQHFLDELAISRQQAQTGQYSSAEDISIKLREKYGL